MLKNKFEKLGVEVSALGFGTMRFPKKENGDIDEAQTEKMLDLAYNSGVNYYDTAYMYLDGKSEGIVGRIMKKYPRDSYFIADKMPLWYCKAPEDMEKIFNEQLLRLGADYIDFYLLHAMDAERFEKCAELGAYEFLDRKRAEGKIRYIGFSFHDSPEVLEKIIVSREWDFCQIQLNYLDWEFQRAEEQYKILEKHGVPCIVMEPVRGGALANFADETNAIFKSARPECSVASWALRFAASLPNVRVVLSGMSSHEQVEDNLNTFADFKPLTECDKEVIRKVLESDRELCKIPCTKCRYCMPCPFGVDIPATFEAENTRRIFKSASGAKEMHKKLSEKGAGYDKCKACGKCAAVCPQHIKIPDIMKELSEK